MVQERHRQLGRDQRELQCPAGDPLGDARLNTAVSRPGVVQCRLHNLGMDRRQLERILIAEGFPADSYVMHGSDRNDTLNIEQQGTKFVVYYTERGSRSDEHEFPSEAEACDYFLESMNHLFSQGKKP